MLRITVISDTISNVTLRLEGRVVSEWGSLLCEMIHHYRAERQKIILDLTDVSYIDEASTAAIRVCSGKNVEIVNYSPFVGSLLRGESNERNLR